MHFFKIMMQFSLGYFFYLCVQSYLAEIMFLTLQNPLYMTKIISGLQADWLNFFTLIICLPPCNKDKLLS